MSAARYLNAAHWISAPEPEIPPAGSRPAYEFRTRFTLTDAPVAANLAATAHGVYEAFLNGERVGTDELTPGLTSYAKTLYVQRYDVAALLRAGENELRLVVSDGWYRGRCGAKRVPDGFGTETAVLAQLRIDGRTIATGLDWEVGIGAITAADLMDGQSSDLNRLDATAFAPVVAAADPLTADRDRLDFSPAPPVRRIREYAPISIRRLSSGRQLVDFGQNLNGWVRLAQLGPVGTRITLTHGEALDHDGDLTLENLEYTQYPDPDPLPTGQIDTVISRGELGDVFEPRHTTHGFQYVAVDGLAEPLQPEAITAVLVHTGLRPTGSFRSSDERLDRLHEIAVASWRSNACDIPTDCPQRERWGYTGDYQIFIRSAAFLDDVHGFSRKWLRSLADDQRADGCITNVAPNTGVVPDSALPITFDGSAGWGDAATIVPWQLYQTYGDESVLAENLEMMRRWVDYAAHVAATQRYGPRAERRPVAAAHERYLWDAGFHWGEWAEPGGSFDFTADRGIVATAYLHRSASILGRSYTVLGQPARAAEYEALADAAARAWRTEYLGSDGRLGIESQANSVRALAFGLIPDELRAAVVARLVELIRAAGTRLGTGFLATPYLLPVLADNGELSLAYELLFQDREPSWMTMLQRGASTVWESWGGIDAEGVAHDSLNHYSKGAVIDFMHEYIAGIRIAAPGAARLQIDPRPGGGLRSAAARFDSVRGAVVSDWRIDDGTFRLRIEVPAPATVVLPGGARHEVDAGTHAFAEPEGGRG